MNIKENVLLAEYTRFGIGGPASFFVVVKNLTELQEALKFAQDKNLRQLVIGEGTNLLVSDLGFRGLVIKLDLSEIKWDEEKLTVEAECGVNLQTLIDTLSGKGWGGMENMYGIPGGVGAAVYGNVGAYGTEIKDVLVSVTALKDGQVVTMQNNQCEFDYRSSIFKHNKDWFVLSATLQLSKADPNNLKQHNTEIMNKRLEKYPVGLKCPGSYFKNIKLSELAPEQMEKIRPFMEKVKGGKLASGVLLEAVGGKGMSVGDAIVADYHANLIFNKGQAKSSDVRELAEELKALVNKKFNILLQEEVQYVGL